MAHKAYVYALPVAIGWVAAVGLLAMARNSQATMRASTRADAFAQGRKGANEVPSNGDNCELWSMVLASQNEHDQRVPGMRLPPAQIVQRDDLRVDRVRKMYQAGLLVTPKDFYNGAVILQKGHASSDLILAHDLAVVALSKGLKRATWLTAETEDKYLISQGKPQRFATQYEADASGFPKLVAVDPGVTDAHRLSVGADTLSDAEHGHGVAAFAD